MRPLLVLISILGSPIPTIYPQLSSQSDPFKTSQIIPFSARNPLMSPHFLSKSLHDCTPALLHSSLTSSPTIIPIPHSALTPWLPCCLSNTPGILLLQDLRAGSPWNALLPNFCMASSLSTLRLLLRYELLNKAYTKYSVYNHNTAGPQYHPRPPNTTSYLSYSVLLFL